MDGNLCIEDISVCKVGGGAVPDAKSINDVVEMMISDSRRKYLVVSAPGKTSDRKYKVTDLLFNCAKNGEHKVDGVNINLSKEESAKEVISIYRKNMDDLGFAPEQSNSIIDNFISDIDMPISDSEKRMAQKAALGERYNGMIVYQHAKNKGINCSIALPEKAGFLLKGSPTNAEFDMTCSDNVRNYLKSLEGMVMIPGYYGVFSNGDIGVLPRSGSDITQTFIANVMDARRCENFTDVDYIYSADPRIVTNPKPLIVVCYDEIGELSYLGSKVPHTALPHAVVKGTQFIVKNIKNPNAQGTLICTERIVNDDEVITGVASKKGYIIMTISNPLLNNQVGAVAGITKIIADHDISFEHLPTGYDNVSIVIEKNKFGKRDELDNIRKEILRVIPGSNITIKDKYAEVGVAGRGMIGRFDVGARILTALSRENIYQGVIDKGEISFFVGVPNERADDAVRAIYQEFFPN